MNIVALGATGAAGICPVAVRAIFCGLPVTPLAVITSVLDSAPIRLGEKLRVMLQLDADTVPAQPLAEMPKSAASPPDVATLVNVAGGLVIVQVIGPAKTVIGGLASRTLPRFRLEGKQEMEGVAATPVPVRLNTCGLPVAFDVTVKVPL